jgi:hypothetical protein
MADIDDPESHLRQPEQPRDRVHIDLHAIARDLQEIKAEIARQPTHWESKAGSCLFSSEQKCADWSWRLAGSLGGIGNSGPTYPNPASIGLGAAPSIEMVRNGCGNGWRRFQWRDQRDHW